MKNPVMRHTKKCLKLLKELDRARWCAGNGACGSSGCNHGKVREDYIEAHKACQASLKERVFEHQQITSSDGKSRAAGD